MNYKLYLLFFCVCLLNQPAIAADPTRPLNYQMKRAANWLPRLESILIMNNKKIAVVDGRYCYEKQACAGGILQRLEQDKVVISWQGQQRVLFLGNKKIAIKTYRQGNKSE